MDQRSLYEQQFGTAVPPSQAENQFHRRDEFVIGYLKTNLSRDLQPPEVLELSIGDAALSIGLLTRVAGVRLTAVDIARNRLDHLRGAAARVGICEGDRLGLRELNLDMEFRAIAADAYNCVLALDVLEHVFDVFGFVENCARVLKPGGMLLLRVPNIAYVKHRVRLALGQLPVTASWFGTRGRLTAWREKHGWDGGHLHLFTLPIIRTLLEEAGLRPVLWGDPGSRLSAIRDLWPSMLYGNIFVVAWK